MEVVTIISIIISITAILLFYWLKKDQKISYDLHEGDLEAAKHAYNALMSDFNNYQVTTDRKITELEKQLEVERNTRVRQLDSLRKQLPSIIGKIVSQVEFAQDTINRNK